MKKRRSGRSGKPRRVRVLRGRGSWPESTHVASNARIAVPSEETYRSLVRGGRVLIRPVLLGANTHIMEYATLYEGAEIGSECFIDSYCSIGFGSQIGDSCRVEYRAQVCDRVTIGRGTVIGGFICDAANVGSECKIMGSLVHGLTEPDLPWGQYEPSPEVRDGVVVGWGATVVGGVVVGANSFVAANAIVTKSVPANTVVHGLNKHVPLRDWHGLLIRKECGSEEQSFQTDLDGSYSSPT